MNKNFALLGAAGFVAPRHLRAIKDTGNRLLAACDPNDSVGVIDSYFPEASFFTEVERFDRFLEKQKRKPESERVHYLSVCSPNYLHDAHVRLGLRVGADAICEKPLVISPWNLDQLAALERETGRRVFTILQLRLLPNLIAMREEVRRSGRVHDVVLTYITRRGKWYHVSWKGDVEKSGGLAMNIGIHLFDLMIWMFGAVRQSSVNLSQPDRIAGSLQLEFANVRWFLSVNAADLPNDVVAAGKPSSRVLSIDGRELEFSEGFTDLHTRAYERVLAGDGFGIDDARSSIELAYRIRTARATDSGDLHPLLRDIR